MTCKNAAAGRGGGANIKLKLNAARVLLAVAGLLASAGVLASPTEYQVKAVFLFNFSRFVEWPAAAFESADAPFVVGVFGHDPFGSDLDEVMKGKSVNGRPLVVRRLRSAAEGAGCRSCSFTSPNSDTCRRCCRRSSATARSQSATFREPPSVV